MLDKEKSFKVYRYWIMLEPDPKPWSYVGRTSLSLKERAGGLTGKKYIECCFRFGAAIETYGWPNFQVEVLEDDLTEEESYEREQYWIQYYNSIEHGFNTSRGGKSGTSGTHTNKGFHHSQETKEHISQELTGIVRSEEVKKKMSIAQKGHPVSVEAKIKNAEAHKVFSILQYDLKGNLIGEYRTLAEASLATGAKKPLISKVINKKRLMTAGSYWEVKRTN